MAAEVPPDPLNILSRFDRRHWRRAVRRTVKEHEAEQLATLRGVAATGGTITGVSTAGGTGLTDSIEMIIDGRRVRGIRVHRPTVAVLKDLLGSIAGVPLAAATRYGPYWVLTFKTAAEPLVVLVDRLVILPDWGGGHGGGEIPSPPVLQVAC